MSETSFQPVNPQVKLPSIEEDVLAFWEKEKVFVQSLEKTEDNDPYVFYDGPPFATGLPHYGHLIAGTIKDIVPRYQTMHGKYVNRRFGWDCHGLPVENEMEKEFKVSGKKDIEKLGLHLFNEACRSIVLRYTKQWEYIVLRMGRWVDLVNKYHTMDPSFMESIWWVFKQVWDKNLIYSGFRVQPYCPRCTTPLSNFEVNEGYKMVKGPSITISFPLKDDPKTKILVWTTTPWTLPSNVLLAVGKNISYVKIKDGDESFIIAKDRLSAYYKDEDSYEVVEELTGSDLIGKRYEPMFDYFKTVSEDFFQVTDADFVSTEDGTGIVHIAPAFGEDDFNVGKKKGLPIVCPVDEEGKFTNEVPEWEGKLVYTADEEITQHIKSIGRLIHRTKIEHRYPHCYRCDTPLIYKSIDTWFMKIDPLKENMQANNKEIHWVPGHLQNGRFGKGIQSAPDWNISRNRYWGTPIPLWQCECGHTECVGSLDQLHTLAGGGDSDKGRTIHANVTKQVSDKIKSEAKEKFKEFGIDDSWTEKVTSTQISENDIHTHIVDEIKLTCPKCGKIMKRTPEVLDCWFESGSMPYAQNHYPFENKEVFEKGFPADFVAEGLDQTRGWFYTLTVLSSALFNKKAFKNVIVNGIILAEDGKKLSKRLKNYEPPEKILNKLGADALRLFLINSPAVKAEDLRFSEDGVRDMARAVLIPFWNSYSFFVTYANVDNWSPKGTEVPKSSNELDKWILSLLNHLVSSVNKEMEQYHLYKVVPLLVDFIDNLTNWYIRRSRRRFWKSENDSDKDQAYSTLYYVLIEFSKVMAPYLPFLTESIYRNLVASKNDSAPISIHLCDYPVSNDNLIDNDLEFKMATVRQVVAMGRTLRSRFTLKIRQPLADITIILNDEKKVELLKDMSSLVKEELNIKEVRFSTDENSVVSLSAKANFRTLGRVFGSNMKNAAAEIEKLTIDQIKSLEAGGTINILGKDVNFSGIEIRRTKHDGIEVETDGNITVALNTEISEDLKNEGHARELVNRVQNLRKSRDFNVTDRIIIACSCDDKILNALKEHKDYIMNETLAKSIEWGLSGKFMSEETVTINGFDVKIDIIKS